MQYETYISHKIVKFTIQNGDTVHTIINFYSLIHSTVLIQLKITLTASAIININNHCQSTDMQSTAVPIGYTHFNSFSDQENSSL